MAEAYYEPTPATDGATMNPVPGAVFEVYEIADTTFSTPLSLRVGSGNPTTTVTASATLATLPGVYVTSSNFEHIWKSGEFQWRRDSIDGAKKAVDAARKAAEDAAGLLGAPADDAMAAAAKTVGGKFSEAMGSTYALIGAASGNAVTRWEPNTAYGAGVRVVAPNGDIVTAKASFTSGATYDATKWDASTEATRVTSVKEGTQLVTGTHLDIYKEPGKYFQPSNANAVTANGYPIAKAGVFDVSKWGGSTADPSLMEQYWPYDYDGFFFRHVYFNSKTWKEIPTKTAVQGMIDGQVAPAVSSRATVTCIGDSLTDGYSNGAFWANAEKWPTILDGLLPTAATLEYGFAGHTTDAAMIYIGGLKPRFKIPGGVIPSDGTLVPITTPEQFGIQPGSLAIGGTLAGVNGTLEWDGTNGWRFKSLGGASGSALTGIYEFNATRKGTWENTTAIIWLGRNDISNATKGMEATVPDHVVASTKRLVAALTPRVKQVMICGVTTRVSEESGSQQHTWVTEINTRLRELYPEYYRSAQDYLRDEALADQGITPTATDNQKIAAGTVPPSVMDDDTHISKATADAMARYFFQPYLTGRGYVDA